MGYFIVWSICVEPIHISLHIYYNAYTLILITLGHRYTILHEASTLTAPTVISIWNGCMQSTCIYFRMSIWCRVFNYELKVKTILIPTDLTINIVWCHCIRVCNYKLKVKTIPIPTDFTINIVWCHCIRVFNYELNVKTISIPTDFTITIVYNVSCGSSTTCGGSQCVLYCLFMATVGRYMWTVAGNVFVNY
jgi:hypothetical protein